MALVGRIDPFVQDAVGVLQYSATVTGGISPIRDGAGRITDFAPGGQDGLQTATLTVTDLGHRTVGDRELDLVDSTLPRPGFPDLLIHRRS